MDPVTLVIVPSGTRETIFPSDKTPLGRRLITSNG